MSGFSGRTVAEIAEGVAEQYVNSKFVLKNTVLFQDHFR